GIAAAADDPSLHAYVSHIHFQKAEAQRTGMLKSEALDIECRNYATCATTGGKLVYHDWTVEGGNNINYGMIPWTLPNDASVAILGDWGTGLPDAKALVQ